MSMKRAILRTIFLDDHEPKKTKFIQERVQIVEKYIPQFNTSLNNYIKKTGSLRDRSLRVSTVLLNFANSENVNCSLKKQMSDFSNILSDIEKCREIQETNMKDNILTDLADCNKLCKHVRSEIKQSIAFDDKEKIRLSHLKRVQESNPQEQQIIAVAEAELLKAKTEALQATKSLEDQIDLFEKRKSQVIRDSLVSWATSELQFHAQALELYTKAYRIAAAINIDSDIEDFREKLQSCSSGSRTESLLHILSSSFNRRSEPLVEDPPTSSPLSSSSSRLAALN